MTQDEIIRMAREIWGERAVLPFNELERFAALVAAHEREAFKVYVNQVVADREMAVHDAVLAEREACAKVCDEIAEGSEPVSDYHGGVMDGAGDCAAAIRARGEK